MAGPGKYLFTISLVYLISYVIRWIVTKKILVNA